MSIYSKTLLVSQNHTFYDTVLNVTGDPQPGDGYYNRSDGVHTVQWSITDFIGTITIEATLNDNPTDTDWFPVQLNSTSEFTIDTTGKMSQVIIRRITYETATTGSFVANFVGNYVWIRAKATNWTGGTIRSVMLSH